MLNDIKKDAQARMAKSIDALRHTLVKVRTGRASTALVEHLKVNYYGSDVPLSQVATVTISDSRSLTITPWEKQIVGAVEKAILASDLGLTPNTAGTTIRLNLPALTEERRKELSKVVHGEGDYAPLAPALPKPMPDWSPVATFGGYWRTPDAQLRQRAPACACDSACGVHGHAHLKPLQANVPAGDARGFWGVFGCSCWAI